MLEKVYVGDIVLRNQPDGTQTPSIIVRLDSQTSAVLYDFNVGGSGGTADPIERGTQPGQRQPRPQEHKSILFV